MTTGKISWEVARIVYEDEIETSKQDIAKMVSERIGVETIYVEVSQYEILSTNARCEKAIYSALSIYYPKSTGRLNVLEKKMWAFLFVNFLLLNAYEQQAFAVNFDTGPEDVVALTVRAKESEIEEQLNQLSPQERRQLELLKSEPEFQRIQGQMLGLLTLIQEELETPETSSLNGNPQSIEALTAQIDALQEELYQFIKSRLPSLDNLSE